MPKFRWVNKEKILLPALLLAVAFLTALFTFLNPKESPQADALTENSIYNSGPSGYKAWFLTTQKAGFPIKTWESSFDDLALLPVPATMLIVRPFTLSQAKIVFGHKEADKLLGWVAQGNTLVLLDDFSRYGSNAMAYRLRLAVKKPPFIRQNSRRKKQEAELPLKPHPLQFSETGNHLKTFIQAPLLSSGQNSLQRLSQGNQVIHPLLVDARGQAKLLRINYEGGTLIFGTVSDLAENQYLHAPRNDNYQFLSNLLKAENAPIFVNEFVHGYVETGDLISYYQKRTPLGSIFAQIVLFFFMLLWLSLVRWTPKPKEEEHSFKTKTASGQTAYIESLAGLYLKSKSPSLALGPHLNRIQAVLHKRHRIRLDEEARLSDLLATLFADYSNTENAPPLLMEALRKAQAVVQKREALSPRELLKISRQLSTVEERVSHGNRILSSTR